MSSNSLFCHDSILPHFPALVSTLRRYTTVLAICQIRRQGSCQAFPFAARTLAHCALAAAAIFALAATLIFLRPFVAPPADEVDFAFPPLLDRYRAQRARAASAIFRRPSGLICRRPAPRLTPPAERSALPPSRMRPSSLFSRSIWSLISAARRNCDGESESNWFVSIEPQSSGPFRNS